MLFELAAAAEIGGAWLIWQSVREGRDSWRAGLGVLALGAYGFSSNSNERPMPRPLLTVGQGSPALLEGGGQARQVVEGLFG